MTDLELRNSLRALGYDARLVNVDCFDIHQAGYIHYLSNDEARALAAAPREHPLELKYYATKSGLNYWYKFPEAL